MVASFPNFNGQVQSIEGDRLGAAKVLTESLLRLDQAFITLLDHEDILSLIAEMRRIVDRALGTVPSLWHQGSASDIERPGEER